VHRVILFGLICFGTLAHLVAHPAHLTLATPEAAEYPPVTLPAQLGGPGWDDQFGFPGTSFYISALAAGGGNLFVGISPFSGSVGYVDVSHIARWDGRRWHRMGAGLDSPPADMAVVGGDLYVVGGFERAGDDAIAGVARWDAATQAWKPVGSGVGPQDDSASPSASAVAILGGQLYIGGDFVSIDGVEAFNLARWDGTAWAAVGDGLEYEPTGRLGEVCTLAATPDGRLAVGGKFTHAFDAPGAPARLVNHIAIWSPAEQRFFALGGGLDLDAVISSAEVYSIVATTSELFVGGEFDEAGGVAVRNVARWDGAGWHDLGGGANGTVAALLLAPDGALYVGGVFDKVGPGVGANRIAKLSGAGWEALGTGVVVGSPETAVVADIKLVGTQLFVGGTFDAAGTAQSSNIAIWNLSGGWEAMGRGLEGGVIDSEVNTLAVGNGIVYAGGEFTTADGAPSAAFAAWRTRSVNFNLDKRLFLPTLRR